MLQLWFTEEFPKMMIGFIIIILISKGKRNKVPFIWYISHVIILAISIGWALYSLNPVPYSETPQSIALAGFTFKMYIAAFGWVLSIFCLIVGIRISFNNE